MIRIIPLSLILILSFNTTGFACKCVMPGSEIRDAYQEADVVFIGQCIKAEYFFQKDASLGSPHIVRYSFDVKHVWKGASTNSTITVDTGMGFGDCGF